MTVQDYIVEQAELAANEAFRYAKAVPADKLDWAPEGARSVISIAREIAMTPTWALFGFSDEKWEPSDEGAEAAKREQESWTTVEQCQEQFNERYEALADKLRSFSEEDLKKTKWLPFNGGRDHTFLEMMDYPRWNCTYHTGQIAYIQTLYGDQEMY